MNAYRYLLKETKEFEKELIRPFGSFNKVRYSLYRNKDLIYSFVTTIYSEEEAIKLLTDMCDLKEYLIYSTITKKSNGIETVIYKYARFHEKLSPNKKQFVKDNYVTMSEPQLAKELGVHRKTIYNFRRKENLIKYNRKQ